MWVKWIFAQNINVNIVDSYRKPSSISWNRVKLFRRRRRRRRRKGRRRSE
jgi:hypothetical protein